MTLVLAPCPLVVEEEDQVVVVPRGEEVLQEALLVAGQDHFEADPHHHLEQGVEEVYPRLVALEVVAVEQDHRLQAVWHEEEELHHSSMTQHTQNGQILTSEQEEEEGKDRHIYICYKWTETDPGRFKKPPLPNCVYCMLI